MTFVPAEPEFEKMVREKIAGNHYTNFIGFQITDIKPGSVEGHLDLQEHHLQQMSFVHGGVTATVADVVAGFAAFTLVKKGQGVVTVELKVSYLNPAQGDKLYARGYVLKAGQHLLFCESEIWVEKEGKKLLTAKATTTMAIVVPQPKVSE